MVLLVGASLLLATFGHLQRRRSRLRRLARPRRPGVSAGVEISDAGVAARVLRSRDARARRGAGRHGGRRHQRAAALGRQLVGLADHRGMAAPTPATRPNADRRVGHAGLARRARHPAAGRTPVHRGRQRARAARRDRQPRVRGSLLAERGRARQAREAGALREPRRRGARSSASSTTCSTRRCRGGRGRSSTIRTRRTPDGGHADRRARRVLAGGHRRRRPRGDAAASTPTCPSTELKPMTHFSAARSATRKSRCRSSARSR